MLIMMGVRNSDPQWGRRTGRGRGHPEYVNRVPPSALYVVGLSTTVCVFCLPFEIHGCFEWF